ncbi:MAG: hypothetical protein AABY96_13165 [Nitrospirota bacterium]
MSNGALFVKFFYAGHFGLAVPSHYFLKVEEKDALVRLLRNISPVEILDFTNELIPDPGGGNFRLLKKPIESPSSKSMELGAGTRSVATERQDVVLHELKESKILDFPHRLTIDPISIEEYKLFKTRDWTDIVVIYEVEDIDNITSTEATFFQRVLDRFIQVYRLITKDSRIRYFQDVQEAIHWNLGKVRFAQDEMTKSVADRLAAARESVQFKDSSINFPYAHEGFFEFDTARATQWVFDFLKTNRLVSIAQELFLRAHDAAYHRKNFRYALIECFTAVEVCISSFLIKSKLSRGVSSKKLKDYQDEIPMAYKLNIELPLFLENLTENERQVIGGVDWLRKKRNDVIHEAKPVSETEAKEAVRVTGAVFDLLIARGIDLQS